jgi:AcrR family transcriptional regulator
MPRTVMRPEDRRRELLDHAQALFFERGYDATSVNDVIAAAGTSKGAFYHHFPSKESLLEALAERLAHQSIAQVQHVLDDPSLSAVERLNRFLERTRQLKVESAPELLAAFAAVFRSENVVLYHRLNTALVAVMAPVLARIIAQGVDEGFFDTPDPQVTAEMLLSIGASSHQAVARAILATTPEERDAAADLLDRHLQLQGLAIDRILGLPDGTVRFAEPGFGRAVLAVE